MPEMMEHIFVGGTVTTDGAASVPLKFSRPVPTRPLQKYTPVRHIGFGALDLLLKRTRRVTHGWTGHTKLSRGIDLNTIPVEHTPTELAVIYLLSIIKGIIHCPGHFSSCSTSGMGRSALPGRLKVQVVLCWLKRFNL